MIKIAHISDLHIGSAQWGIKERKQAHYDSLLKLSDQLFAYDTVMVTGDVFDSPEPSPSDIVTWIQFCKNIADAGTTLLVNVGNHDEVIGSTFQWVDVGVGSDDFLRENPDRRISCAHGMRILCLDYINRKDIKATLDTIPDNLDIIMMHQSAGGFLPSIMRPQLDDDDMKFLSTKCKYLALGDLHIHKIMKMDGGCIAAYPGTTFFLKLGEPHDDFRFISLDYDEDKHKIKKIESIPFEPTQKSIVGRLGEMEWSAGSIKENPGAFFIARHYPSQDGDIEILKEIIEKDYPGTMIKFHRDKEKKVVAPAEEEGVTEDTDFISLVEKEASLEKRDVDLVADIWANPTSENVSAILDRDLKQELTTQL